MSCQSINPCDDKVGSHFKELSDLQLEQAIATAQSCIFEWKTQPYAERAVILKEAASLLRGHVEKIWQNWLRLRWAGALTGPGAKSNTALTF